MIFFFYKCLNYLSAFIIFIHEQLLNDTNQHNYQNESHTDFSLFRKRLISANPFWSDGEEPSSDEESHYKRYTLITCVYTSSHTVR